MNQIAPRHFTASLAVGVAGSHPVGPLLALVLRDYGGHRVVGYGLDGQTITETAEAVRWTEQPIAECPTPQHLARLSDLILLTEPGWCATLAKACDEEGTHPPVVVSVPTSRVALRLMALRLRNRNPLGYSPVNPDAHLDELASPHQIWVASQNPQTHDLVERMWRPVINSVPVVHVGFSRVSETGLLLPPSARDGSVPVSTPPALPGPSEG